MIYYEIAIPDPKNHLFHINMKIMAPSMQGQICALPNWNPGSYLIRDYAKNIVELKAYAGEAGEKPLGVRKIASNRWQCEPCEGVLTLVYTVYAFDTSVRGAYLDAERAFFNGASVFLQAVGHEKEKCFVYLKPPSTETVSLPWRIATNMPREHNVRWGPGWFYAENYEALIDYPVEMGTFETLEFQVHGILHTVVITGKHGGECEILKKDLQKICQAHCDLFQMPVPFEQYLFLLTLRQNAYGGLEHRDSSALQMSPYAMPKASGNYDFQKYHALLSLFSHEYFHAWNIKKIKPSVFIPYTLEDKAYTTQLWMFEGFTSYYEQLALVRSRIITQESYFKELSKLVSQLLQNPGREKQTLAESSFDAWIKFYQPNENTNNVCVSYYLKGALVAWFIDLSLRLETQHAVSLDSVMRKLMREFGLPQQGVPEKAIEEIIVSMGGKNLHTALYHALYTTEALPLDNVLGQFGLQMTLRTAFEASEMPPNAIQRGSLGCRFKKSNGIWSLSYVAHASPAEKAGLCPYDEVVAINDVKFEEEDQLKNFEVGEIVRVHVFRANRLIECEVTLDVPPCDKVEITLKAECTKEEKKHLQTWLYDA